MTAKMLGLSGCFVLALFSVAVVGSSVGVSEMPQIQQPNLEFLRGFSKATDALRQSTMRAILQSGSLCIWDGGECTVNIGGNLPDSELLDLLERTEACERERDESGCNSASSCKWDSNTRTCQIDLVNELEDCIVPEYITIIESGQCSSAFDRSECTSLGACEWNSATDECEVDRAELEQAIRGNSDLEDAVVENAECADSSSCRSPCVDTGSSCVYGPLFDWSEWFESSATSTKCQTLKETLKCDFLGVSDQGCSGTCETNEDGVCVPTAEARIEALFAADPDALERVLVGAQSCPDFDDADECEDFRGRR